MNCLQSNKPAPDGDCWCAVCSAVKAVAPVLAKLVVRPDVGPVDVVKTKCECPDCRGDHPQRAYSMVLTCPRCGLQHIDEAEFATKLHKRHKCVDRVVLGDVSELAAGAAPPYTTLPGCGFEWQPALVFTVGVEGIL